MSRPIKRRIVDAKSERSMEKIYRTALLSIGAAPFKIEPKHVTGWPDTYVPPNIHIEFKRVRWLSTRPIKLLKHFDDLQIVQLRKLHEHGCRCFVVIFWDLGSLGEFVQTISFTAALRHETWTHDLTLPFSDPINEIRDHVKRIWMTEEVDGRKITSLSPPASSTTELAGF